MNQFKIKKNVELKKLTTFKVGGMAEYFVEIDNIHDLKQAINFAREKDLLITVIGGGSNMLVSDNGIRGLVIKYKNKTINIDGKGSSVYLTAGAGNNWDYIVEIAVNNELQGIECLSGIPGSVGAAPIQNIGAYGQELKDVFVGLKAFNFSQNKIIQFSKQDCEFGYRDSFFKKLENKGNFLILEITLKLKKNVQPDVKYQSLIDSLEQKGITDPTLAEVRHAVLELRGLKLEDPNLIGNAGSFFKNPIIDSSTLNKIREENPELPSFELGNNKHKVFAGWLIDKAGWKGRSFGRAKVSDKNALIITNTGNASADDIVNLAKSIQDDVYQKFKVKLEPEVNIL